MIFVGDDYTTIVPRAKTGISLNSLNQINDLQTNLCKMSNVYCFSVKKDVGVFASYFGSEKEKKEIENLISLKLIYDLCSRFSDPVIETVIPYDTDVEHVKMTGFAICGNDKTLVGVNVLIGILDTAANDERIDKCLSTTSKEEYDKTVLFVEHMIKHFFHEKFYAANLEEDLSHVEAIGRSLEKQLSKNEVLTNVLKMLESDNDFAKISEDVLREASNYLKIDDCMLLRLNIDETTIDCIGEWAINEEMALGNKFSQFKVKELPFFNGKSYTISSDSLMPDVFSDFFENAGISAGVFLPLEANDKPGLYIVFVSISERKWTVEELRFLQDVKRVLQTILIKRITKNSLASSYNALEAILENAGCGICVDDISSGKNLYLNETFKNFLDDEEDIEDINLVISKASHDINNIHNYYAVNSEKWFDITFAKTHWVDGREVRLATVYDVTDVKKYQKEIERQASTDHLTGLYNRKQCEVDLQQEIRKANVSKTLGALLYMDLDDFKNINDGLGHRVGDRLLVEVARALDNVTGKANRCYRVGGDEFIVLVPTSEYHRLEEICNHIAGIFSKSWKVSDTEYYCTMSMGYVTFPTNGTDVQTLIQRADIALSYAKQHGKNRIEAYNEDDATNSVKRLDLEKALREAVADDCREFEVYYQPVVNITGDEAVCCGAEALVRWQSKEFGFMNPAEFIPLAEYLGLIVPIGEHVLVEACKRCKYWNDFGHPDYKVNVNLSVVQLMQNDIVDTVANALKVSGINPSNLTLEVTEGLAINDMNAMKNILGGIKELGVRVALDDFGTGYSSLNHIKSMPLDVIKIDRCFVNGVGADAFSNAFVQTVSELADAIDVNVCVEGVEEESQKDALDDMNIQMIQGFLYDRPLSQDDFERKYLV